MQEEYNQMLEDYNDCKKHNMLKDFFENIKPNESWVYDALMTEYPEDFGLINPWKKVYDAVSKSYDEYFKRE